MYVMNSPFQINFSPNDRSPSGNGFGFSVDLRKDFVEVAKRVKLDYRAYEDDGRKILLGAGYNSSCVEDLTDHGIGIYGWHKDYSGLLLRATVPGFQENQIELNILWRDYRFISHNIDDSQQFAASFALINRWLNDITYRM